MRDLSAWGREAAIKTKLAEAERDRLRELLRKHRHKEIYSSPSNAYDMVCVECEANALDGCATDCRLDAALREGIALEARVERGLDVPKKAKPLKIKPKCCGGDTHIFVWDEDRTGRAPPSDLSCKCGNRTWSGNLSWTHEKFIVEKPAPEPTQPDELPKCRVCNFAHSGISTNGEGGFRGYCRNCGANAGRYDSTEKAADRRYKRLMSGPTQAEYDALKTKLAAAEERAGLWDYLFERMNRSGGSVSYIVTNGGTLVASANWLSILWQTSPEAAVRAAKEREEKSDE